MKGFSLNLERCSPQCCTNTMFESTYSSLANTLIVDACTRLNLPINLAFSQFCRPLSPLSYLLLSMFSTPLPVKAEPLSMPLPVKTEPATALCPSMWSLKIKLSGLAYLPSYSGHGKVFDLVSLCVHLYLYIVHQQSSFYQAHQHG